LLDEMTMLETVHTDAILLLNVVIIFHLVMSSILAHTEFGPVFTAKKVHFLQ